MEDGKIFIEDFCRNNSTSINNKIDIINGEKKEIQVGTKVFISESIVLRLEEGDVEQDVIESKEMLPDDNLESTEDNELDNDEKALVYLEVNGQIPLFFKPKNSFSYMIELNPTEWLTTLMDSQRYKLEDVAQRMKFIQILTFGNFISMMAMNILLDAMPVLFTKITNFISKIYLGKDLHGSIKKMKTIA